jgi:hypothetical protein
VLLSHLGLETIVRVQRGGVGPGSRFFVRCAHTDPRMGVFRLDEVADAFVDEENVVGLLEGEMPTESNYEGLG